MKTKYILSLLMVVAFLSCKNNEKENAPDLNPQSTESTAAIDSSNAITTEPVTDNSAEDKKLLADFYKKNEKRPQLFLIDNSKDTTLICAEKTRIKINARSFISAKTGKDILGKVQISVKEYYKISDILLAKLSTTTNGNLLETGGMLHLAASSNQDKCTLKKGKTVEIAFPRKEEKKDMQLYTGNWSNNDINWNVLDKTTDLNQIFTTVDKKPEFPGGINKFYNYISNNINVDEEPPTKIIASFTIDREGNVINPKIIKGSSKRINAQIIKLLQNSAKFIPGEMNGIAVNVYYRIPIQILDLELGTEGSSGQTRITPKQFERKYDNDEKLEKASAANISYYLFSSSELGYINCDRLWQDNSSSRIEYALNFNSNSETAVNIVFHDVKSIINGFSKTRTLSFDNIPSGEKITIVAIKYFDKKPYLAIKETETSAKGENDLVFQPITIEMLKSEMKKLDRFNIN